MTRETKIGLIVAGSFLCLVAVVVVSKMRGGDDASKEPEEQTVQVAATKPTQNGSAPKKTDPAPKPPERDTKKPELALPPMLIAPPLPQSDALKELERQKALSNQAKPDGLPLPPSLAPAPTPMPIDIGGLKFPPLENGGSEPKLVPPPALIGAGDKQPMVAFPPPQPLTLVEEKKPATLEFPKEEKKPATLEFPKDVGVTPPPIDVKPMAVPPPLPKDPIKPFNEKDPILPLDSKGGVPMFPALDKPASQEKKLEFPMAPSIDVKPIMPKNPGVTFPPIDTTPKPIPRIGGNEGVTPPININPGFSAPPMPVVKDVNADYVVQQGDTHFGILSMRLYGNEKYADALLAYNRDHAKLIKNGQALLTNPPTLNPGQQVSYPPIAILERDYRGLIRGASGQVPVIPSAPAVKLAPPGPINPGIATISNPPAAISGKTYRVQAQTGESILDIAERALGNRSQWTEIYRINQANPAVRPPALIPAGTELKLP